MCVWYASMFWYVRVNVFVGAWVRVGQMLIVDKFFPQFFFTLQTDSLSLLNSEQNDSDSLASQLAPILESWS